MTPTPLKRWIERNKIKVIQLATESGIHRPHISRYASGTLMPTSTKAAKLSAATQRLTNSDDVLTIEELLFPNGVPKGAVVAMPVCESESEAA